MIEAGTILQNRYGVEKRIGAGGMGTVYLATDKRFNSPVAIKETHFTDQDLLHAFEREARLLNSLRHPALPRVIDYFSEGEGQFLVMEYIAGADLSALMKQNAKFNAPDVLRWADVLLDALDYLHSRRPPVVHRDIKPQNLKLTPRGEIILLDFGLAKGKSGNSSKISLTDSVFGYSRSYSPLEQIQGTGTDPRSDLYSLAATIYHLLAGKQPIDAVTRATTYINSKTDPLESLDKLNPQVSSAVSAVLQNALSLDAASRPASAAAMREALNQARHEIKKPEPAEKTQAAAAVAAAAPVVVAPVETAAAIEETPAPIEVEIPPQQTEEHFEEEYFDDYEPERKSWRTSLSVAAAIAILGGGGLAAWYAVGTPPETGETPQTKIAAPSPTRKNDSDNAKTDAKTSPLPSTNSAATVVKPAEPASKPVSGNSSDSSVVVEKSPAPSPEEVETPKPIIVPSAPPTDATPKKDDGDDDGEEEAPSPNNGNRRRGRNRGSDEERPTRDRRVNDNRQKLPTLLGAPSNHK